MKYVGSIVQRMSTEIRGVWTDEKSETICSRKAQRDVETRHGETHTHTHTHTQNQKNTDLFEVVKGGKDDIMAPSHETHCCQQLQHKGLGSVR